MNRRLAAATLTFATVTGAAFGLSPRAFADDSALPVAEPVVPSQNSSDAAAEAAVTRTSADPAARISDIKARGTAAIAKRQTTLAQLTAKITGQTKDCGSNGAMLAEMSASSTSLNAVGLSLASTTDVATAKTLYRSIFIDHRIYMVVAPKAGKVIRCDVQLQRNDALAAEGAKLQTTIDAAKAKGVDTAAAQAAKDAAMVQLAGINPAAALPGVMGLLPDKGDKAVQASNKAALRSSDAILDGTLAAQRNVNAQFAGARRALGTSAAVTRDSRKTANATARTARQAARK